MPRTLPAARLADLPASSLTPVTLAGEEIVLANVNGTVYALSDPCPHEQAPLHEGLLEGTTLTCPRHAGSLDVTTGAALCAPICKPARTFPVEIKDGNVYVTLPF